MASIFAAFPSYRGISDEEAKERCAEKELVAAGHEVGVGVLRGLALIDLARNELVAAFMRSKCTMTVLQDDDVKIAGPSLIRMIDLLSKREDVGVISAPCRMRSEGFMFNVVLTSAPDEDRLAECMWTGLGCVLVKKEIIARLYKLHPRLWYRSALEPLKSAVGLFNSIIGDAREYEPSAPEGVGIFLGDDRAFSHRLCQAGILIHAYVDAETDHRGLAGNLGVEMKKRDEELRQQGAAPVEKSLLVDGSGRPL